MRGGPAWHETVQRLWYRVTTQKWRGERRNFQGRGGLETGLMYLDDVAQQPSRVSGTETSEEQQGLGVFIVTDFI